MSFPRPPLPPHKQVPVVPASFMKKEELIEFGYNPEVEAFREREYSYIGDATYLDHSGATLYPTSLIDRTSSLLKTQLLGNPHSGNPSSSLATAYVNVVRKQVLNFFNASEDDWDVVFVANATAGIKLVAEGFSGYSAYIDQIAKEGGKRTDHYGFRYHYHRDAHTSLIGVRELAREWHCFAGDEEVNDWLNPKEMTSRCVKETGAVNGGLMSSVRNTLALIPKLLCFPQSSNGTEDIEVVQKPGLFAYPAQSNLTGRRLPLYWSTLSHNCGYFTLLDAAAYLMTAPLTLNGNPLNLPDYVVCSWYKVFGMPDLGALLVKRGAPAEILLHRKYFGGGTVEALVAREGYRRIKFTDKQLGSEPGYDPHDGLEDGTVPFHSITMLGEAFKRHAEMFGPHVNVGRHTSALARYLYCSLSELRHFNGAQVVEFYSTPYYLETRRQGPVLAFNLRNAQGGYVGYLTVEEQASKMNIHVRTGGNCNPGGVEKSLGFKKGELKKLLESGEKSCGDNIDLVGKEKRPVGLVRVSLGASTTFEDVKRFADFIKTRWVEGSEVKAQ